MEEEAALAAWVSANGKRDVCKPVMHLARQIVLCGCAVEPLVHSEEEVDESEDAGEDDDPTETESCGPEDAAATPTRNPPTHLLHTSYQGALDEHASTSAIRTREAQIVVVFFLIFLIFLILVFVRGQQLLGRG